MPPGFPADFKRIAGHIRQERHGPAGRAHHRDIHRQSTQYLAMPRVELVETPPFEQTAIAALGEHGLDDGIHNRFASLLRGLPALQKDDLEGFGHLEGRIAMMLWRIGEKDTAQQQEGKQTGGKRAARDSSVCLSGFHFL